MRGIRSRQVVPKRTLPNQSTMEKGLSACRYKGGEGDEIILLCRGGADQWRNAFDPVLYEIQSPVEPMQDGGDIPFSSFFYCLQGGYITYTLYSGCVGGASCDEPSMTVTLTAAALLQVSNEGGDSTIQMSCCRLWHLDDQGNKYDVAMVASGALVNKKIDRSCGLTLTDNVSTDL